MIRPGSRIRAALGWALYALFVSVPLSASESSRAIDLKEFRVIERESGPDNYYSLVRGPEPYWHAAYRPPFKTMVLGYQFPDAERRAVQKIRWKWRAMVLPSGGDECAADKGDSAAVVYVTFRRTLRWYTLKYVW